MESPVSANEIARDEDVEQSTVDVNGERDGIHSTDAKMDIISNQLRLAKTCCMFMAYMGLGFCLGVAYATVVDMVEQYDATYDAVTDAQMVKAIGLMSGFIFGAPIADRCRARLDVFLFIFSLLFGLSCAAIPWAPNLIVVGVLFVINGLCHSTLDICCVTVCIAMWGKKSPTPILCLYTCLAIGITISPLITAPFLSKPISQNNTENITLNTGLDEASSWIMQLPHVDMVHNDNHKTNLTTTRMEVPYAIFGAWSICIGIIFLIFYIQGTSYPTLPSKQSKSIKDMVNPASWADGSTCFGVCFVAALFICYIFVNGRDRGFGMFIFTIANQGVHTSKETAALILFTYNAVGTSARGLCALISIWVPIQILLLVLVIGAVTLQIIIIFYALESTLYFWILTCTASAFITAAYPSLMAWADSYIEMTGVVMGAINMGIGVGGLSGMFLSGYCFQHYQSPAVLKIALLYGVGFAVIFIPLQIVSHIRGDRYTRMAQKQVDVTAYPNEGNMDNNIIRDDHNIQSTQSESQPLLLNS